jgi:hypothetical protein
MEEECQLGYDCQSMAQIIANKWGDKHCDNENACKEWALSWGLPYRYSAEEKILTVEFRPTRYYWRKETIEGASWDIRTCRINGMEFGYSCPASERMMSADFGSDELDIKDIIIRELTEAGWQEAITLGLQPKITRDGLIAVKPTVLRIIGRLRNLIIDKLRRQ